MFWNDLKEMKEWMSMLTDRLVRIDHSVEKLLGHIQEHSQIYIGAEGVKEAIEDALCSEDEYNSINRIHNKLNTLIEDEERRQAVDLATQTLDKFDDYMKNIDKLNSLINEFKGCVSIARGAIADRKEMSEQEAKTAVLADMTKEIHRAMLAFIQAGDKVESKCHFKLDAIYRAVCEKEEKKPTKKRKPVKKKAPPASLSQ